MVQEMAMIDIDIARGGLSYVEVIEVVKTLTLRRRRYPGKSKYYAYRSRHCNAICDANANSQI